MLTSSEAESRTPVGGLAAPPPRTAIDVANIGKRYDLAAAGQPSYRTLRESLRMPSLRRRAREDFWALREVSFSVEQGEILGVIGRNGAGKSTLLKLLSRVTTPTEGRARIRGRVGSLLEVGTGFHPELSGRENILLNGAILGMTRRETLTKFEEIVEFAGVERFIDTPVKRYSSGMYLRLAFSVAAHLEPEILLVDEVLAVGDAEFQKKCLGRMSEVGRAGRTVVFVSHSMPAMLRLCPRLLLLDRGRLIADGAAAVVVRKYMDSGLGSNAQRTWSDTAPPGDDVAALRSVRVLRANGETADELDVREPLGVEVCYEHRLDAPDVRPAVFLTFRNDDGTTLFHTQDFVNQKWREADRQPGTVCATCWIPGNFLAEGRVYVDVGASSHGPHIEHFVERDTVSFHVVDRSTGDGVRGDWAGEWPGVVRPMLEWQVRLSSRS